jgi:serine/threonine protein kinase
MGTPSSAPVRVLGRYALHAEIASGGMATVHFGRLLGVVGFSKTVAIKRLHPQFAKDPEFVSMFLDEARLAARIRHPNVVSTLDVVALEGELFLVMEYVQGESMRALVRSAQQEGGLIPPSIVATIMVGMLHGLHAAHEAKNERGEPLGIVHRDVSPQNILVGVDGVPRVLDFGVAKAAGRTQTTRDGQVKGKLAYMAPEQIMGRQVTRATDVFAASVVLWEALTARRLFGGASEGEVVKKVLDAEILPPSTYAPGLSPQLDALVLRGLSRDPAERFASAREMARALEKNVQLAPSSDVGEFVERVAGPMLSHRAEHIAKIESSSPHVLLHDGGTPTGSESPPADAGSGPSATDAVAKPPASLPEGDRSSVSNATATTVSGELSLSAKGENPVVAARRYAMRRVAAIAISGAAAVLLVAIGIVLGTRRDPDPAPAPSSGTASAPSSAIPPPPAATVAPTAAASPSDTTATEPSSVAAQPPPPPRSPPTSVSAVTQPAVRPAAHRSAVDCNPPYTVDAQGFRHYKRECAR